MSLCRFRPKPTILRLVIVYFRLVDLLKSLLVVAITHVGQMRPPAIKTGKNPEENR